MKLSARPRKVAKPVEVCGYADLRYDPKVVTRPERIKTRGKEKVEEECCDCDIQLDKEFIEGTEDAFKFYEYPKNHDEFCLYRILCKE